VTLRTSRIGSVDNLGSELIIRRQEKFIVDINPVFNHFTVCHSDTEFLFQVLEPSAAVRVA
jgi:hypothetical protein